MKKNMNILLKELKKMFGTIHNGVIYIFYVLKKKIKMK